MPEADFCLSCGRPLFLEPTIYTRGDLVFDNVRMLWTCGDRSVRLPAGRGEIVELLMKRELVNRSSLILRYHESNNPENLVSVQICKIRKDLAKLESRMKIETLREVGFELTDTRPATGKQ